MPRKVKYRSEFDPHAAIGKAVKAKMKRNGVHVTKKIVRECAKYHNVILLCAMKNAGLSVKTAARVFYAIPDVVAGRADVKGDEWEDFFPRIMYDD